MILVLYKLALTGITTKFFAKIGLKCTEESSKIRHTKLCMHDRNHTLTCWKSSSSLWLIFNFFFSCNLLTKVGHFHVSFWSDSLVSVVTVLDLFVYSRYLYRWNGICKSLTEFNLSCDSILFAAFSSYKQCVVLLVLMFVMSCHEEQCFIRHI